MARRLLWASLALAPVTWILDAVAHPGKVLLFVLSSLALVPLAWLIGEATEHAGEHTGPRIGGLLNASFGNAPEVIIALIAIADNLPDVVRGSLAGSVVSNILLVLGAALVLGEDGAVLQRRSLLIQLGLVALAALLLLIPSIPGWHGNPNRHSLALLSIGPSVALLVVYLLITIVGVRRREQFEATGEPAWSIRTSLVALGAATAATAVTSEILVHSLQDFAEAANLSQFFTVRRPVRGAALVRLRAPADAVIPADRGDRHGRLGSVRGLRHPRRALAPLGGRPADRRLRGLRRLVPLGRRPVEGAANRIAPRAGKYNTGRTNLEAR